MTGAPTPPIEMGPPSNDAGARFAIALTIFMRLLSALWMVEGLLQWSRFLATQPGGQDPFAAMPMPTFVAFVFFAVIDLVAAVGLWLAVPWGGVIWLAAAAVQLCVILALPGFFDHPFLTGALNIVLVAAYLVLTVLSTRSIEPRAAD